MGSFGVHVVPRSRTSQVVGRHGDLIKIKIAASPADGAANEELCRFLAERLGVPRNTVAIVRGATARRKTVEIEGVTKEAAEQLLLMADS